MISIASISNLAGGGTEWPLLLFIAFYIWMIIDCALYESSTGNSKLVWLLIVLFVPLFGPFIYLFARKLQRARAI